MTVASIDSLEELRSSDKLPSPSGVALEILNLTRDQSASGEQMEQVLVRDPALAGQILKYANSARVSGGKPVATVKDAIVRLGMMTVRQLALGFSLLANARGGPCEAFDYGGYWAGSLAAGVAAQAVGKTLRRIDPDVAFTCGLLGQVGRLCLASVHAECYAQVLRQWNGGTSERLLILERDRFASDHNEIGAALFADWGLSEEFQEAVRFQEDPVGVAELPVPRQALPRLLYLANQLALICTAKADARADLVEELLQRGTVLGLDAETVMSGCDEALAEWQRLGEVLDVIVGDVPPIKELVDRARNYLAVIDDPDGPLSAGTGLRVMIVGAAPGDGHPGEELVADGHQVTFAAGGVDALRLALAHLPQIIIADDVLEDMSGADFCEALRLSEETARTYIVLLSESVDTGVLATAFEAGADDCLLKPASPALLAARLKAAERLIGLQDRVENDREELRRVAAQLGVANRRLERAALYDELTQLPNRRFAVERLDQEWARSLRSGAPLVVMLMDIDHFKKVNDSHGHDAGDIVLRETARAMQDCLRNSDVVCRFGGEEFLAICPDADIESAAMLGDRIRAAVADNTVDQPEFCGAVTVSVGVAALDTDMPSPAALLKLADEALYAAKGAGRNLVCFAKT